MKVSEFEERSYEAPLYNQLERGNEFIFTPGQVLEHKVGFDRGLFVAEVAVWRTFGYDGPLRGAALAYYDWPTGWGPWSPRTALPQFRLNLFLQAKRPRVHKRRPKRLRKVDALSAPMWSFDIEGHQQQLLQTLAAKTEGRAHVAYACAAFHTNLELFRHTKYRSIVKNSTFPSVSRLVGHEAWFYDRPGAIGAANPEPEIVEEPDLLSRLRNAEGERPIEEGERLLWLEHLEQDVVETAREGVEVADARNAQFFDDLQVLERWLESLGASTSVRAYARIRLFTVRYDLLWLMVTDAV
jgi:hypothetical protein